MWTEFGWSSLTCTNVSVVPIVYKVSFSSVGNKYYYPVHPSYDLPDDCNRHDYRKVVTAL